MKNYDPRRMELSTRDVVARAIATEILQGRGSANGGVYLDVTHLPREQIETRLPVMLEQFLKFGVDIRVTPMEVAPTAHHIMGGLRITPECHTTLPGLFACGEIAGGVHGANRLGGNSLAETQVLAGPVLQRAKQRNGRKRLINTGEASAGAARTIYVRYHEPVVGTDEAPAGNVGRGKSSGMRRSPRGTGSGECPADKPFKASLAEPRGVLHG